MSAGAGLLLLAWALAAAPVPGTGRLVEHTLRPPRPEAGALAEEVLIVWAPEGVNVRVADEASPAGPVERRGSWWAARSPEAGGVRWTFSAPLVSWTEGAGAGPPLSVRFGSAGAGEGETVQVAGVRFEARSPLEGLDPGTGPAPPEGALPRSVVGWLLALAAMLLLGATGAALRGARPARARPPSGLVGPSAPTLEEALAGARTAPLEAAERLAAAVRAHPRMRGAGVTEAHTTAEVAARVAGEGIVEALALADAVKYGGYVPSAEQVLAAGRDAGMALREAAHA